MDRTKRDLICVDAADKRAVYDATEVELISFEGVDVVTGSDDSEWDDTQRHFGGSENE